MSDPRLIVALDFPEAAAAESFAARLDPGMCRLKVGKELFTRAGPRLVERLQSRGFDIFLDLKYHDIPQTVAGACRAAAELGVWMVNVHALGGPRMMAAAREALEQAPDRRPYLIAVTVLTSHDASTLEAVGLTGPPQEAVVRLAGLAREAGLDGVVCSPEEAARLAEIHGPALMRVTPGVRPAQAAADDQRRIATPSAALAAGSDYLVVGRPVTAAADPVSALRGLAEEVRAAEAP